MARYWFFIIIIVGFFFFPTGLLLLFVVDVCLFGFFRKKHLSMPQCEFVLNTKDIMHYAAIGLLSS